jgi:putative Mg2+ transporter-C (MgtC) family protein
MLTTVLTISAYPIPFAEVLGRFAVSAILGGAIGYNADRSRRPAGMRLYATAGLTGAAIALLMVFSGADAAGTIKTLATASLLARAAALLACSIIFGLICLGLILQQTPYSRPTPGLTAATSLALVAILGVTAGLGLWRPFMVGGALAMLLLKGGTFLRNRSPKRENPL